jgi:Protein of unknown function (DUF2971)
MNTNGLNIRDWDTQIYRVFSLDWFKDMITRKRNGLVRTSKWDDPFENYLLKCKVDMGDGSIADLESILNAWYGQCWTFQRDSDAMWRIYSSRKTGIRVSTTIRKLFAAMCDTTDTFARHKYFIGEVQYESRADIEKFLKTTSFVQLVDAGRADIMARTLCTKRKEFDHEKEVRILFFETGNVHSRAVINFPFAYDEVLDEVVCDPRLEPAEFEKLRTELGRLGCTLSIGQSDLYKIDEVTIPLQ